MLCIERFCGGDTRGGGGAMAPAACVAANQLKNAGVSSGKADPGTARIVADRVKAMSVATICRGTGGRRFAISGGG